MTQEIYLTIETPIKELLFYFISQPYGDALSSDAIKNIIGLGRNCPKKDNIVKVIIVSH
jgi:hypothetical protein